MSSLNVGLTNLWSYLWHLHAQTKDMLRLNFNSARVSFSESSFKAEGEDAAESATADHVEADQIIPSGDPQKGGGLDAGEDYGMRQKIGLFLGPALFLLFLLMPTPAEMSIPAQRALASTAWVATWWITEAIPIPATSLLPVVLFTLTGVMSAGAATAPYANTNVFLFMGGFMIAVCMERWNLHLRVALSIIKVIGTGPNRLILGFMVATAFLSMWISNTATTMMMMPIGLAVIMQVAQMVQKNGIEGIDVRQGKFNFGTCLMLSIAYAASIGGVATLIGTPPNIVFAGAAEEMFGIVIGFDQWLMYGLPVSAVFLVLAWLYMTRKAYPTKLKEIPGGRELVESQLRSLGAITREEKLIAAVFGGVALAWMTRSFLLVHIFPMIHDSVIAILGAVITFLIPVNIRKGVFLNDWRTAVNIPWGILLLFGGGLCIAAGFTETGLAGWIGMRLSALEGAPMFLIMLAVVTLVIYLTEITSNTATTSMMMPIMAAMATAMLIHPFALMITAATAASYAFMLPVATPPNAVIFGSGYVTIPDMVKAGVWLNLLGIAVITLFAYLWLPLAWGIDVDIFPAW
ncbi:MAG: DASS family sodium-coupled anion symporter [Bacillota bacterium]